MSSFKDAWNIATQLSQKKFWLEIGKAALQNLEIEEGNIYKSIGITDNTCTSVYFSYFYLSILSAIRVYRHLKDVGMVLSLESVKVCRVSICAMNFISNI